MDPSTFGVTADLAEAVADSADSKLLWSVLAVASAWAVRHALMRRIRRGEGLLSDRQRWWLSLVKNLTVVTAMGALVAIWADEIQNAALSLAAVAVALVVATKELILCVSAATWRGITQPFTVGDWIEIGPFSGEVIDESLLSTELQEIDPHDFQVTGRTVSFPNSLLLTQPVVNHQFRKRFLPLTFEIREEGFAANLAEAAATRDRILDAVRSASGDFCDVARRYAARIEKSTGAKLRDPSPHVEVMTTDLAKLIFRVSVFCPRDRAPAIREAAMAAFLARG